MKVIPILMNIKVILDLIVCEGMIRYWYSQGHSTGKGSPLLKCVCSIWALPK